MTNLTDVIYPATTIPCPRCGAPAGRGCEANSGRPTTAHKDRIGRAELLAHTGIPDVWLRSKLAYTACDNEHAHDEHPVLTSEGIAAMCPGHTTDAAPLPPVATAHTNCYIKGLHAKTPAARAACRKARATA